MADSRFGATPSYTEGCPACGVQAFTSPVSQDQHLNGKRHAAMLKSALEPSYLNEDEDENELKNDDEDDAPEESYLDGCEACGIAKFPSWYQYNEHMAGRRHARTLEVEEVRRRRGFTHGYDGDRVPYWAVPGCDVCGVHFFASEYNESQHNASGRHADAVCVALEQGCPECRISYFQTLTSRANHLRSDRHADTLRALERARAIEPATLDTHPEDGCRMCGVARFTSEAHRDDHVRGRRHGAAYEAHHAG